MKKSLKNDVFKYKGYIGSAEVDTESRVLVGRLLFIQDIIGYSGSDLDSLEKAFHEAVDDYLQTCAELGEEPDTPCKGTFNVRVGPQRHRDANVDAVRRGISLNEWVALAFDTLLAQSVEAASPRVQQVSHQAVAYESTGIVFNAGTDMPRTYQQQVTSTGVAHGVSKPH